MEGNSQLSNTTRFNCARVHYTKSPIPYGYGAVGFDWNPHREHLGPSKKCSIPECKERDIDPILRQERPPSAEPSPGYVPLHLSQFLLPIRFYLTFFPEPFGNTPALLRQRIGTIVDNLCYSISSGILPFQLEHASLPGQADRARLTPMSRHDPAENAFVFLSFNEVGDTSSASSDEPSIAHILI